MKRILLPFLFLIALAANSSAQHPGSYNAMSFDGVDDYVLIPDDKSIDITGSITIEAWINADAFATNQWENSIFSKDSWAGKAEQGYVLRCGSKGILSFNIATSAGWKEVASGSILTTGKWYHVVGSYDGDTLKVYVNGVLQAINLYKGSITSSAKIDARIGLLAYTAQYRAFDGLIDEVRLWNKELSVKTIRDYMCQKVTKTHPDYSNLVGYWQFDEDKGKRTFDTSSYANDGSINGPIRTRSSAPIGDTSIYSYSSPKSLGYTSPDGDRFTMQKISGSPTSAHLYYVGEKTDIKTDSATVADLDSNHYWGTYLSLGKSPSYSVNYNYANYSAVNSTNKCDIDLLFDPSPKSGKHEWKSPTSYYYPSGDSLVLNSRTSEQYILGFYGSDRKIKTNKDDSVFCEKSSITLAAPGNPTFRYQWYLDGKKLPGDTLQQLAANKAGKYKVDVIRSKSCYFQTKEKSIYEQKLTTVTLSAIKGVCESVDSVLLKGASPAGGVFTGKGVAGKYFLASKVKAGNYPVVYTYTDKYGCANSDTQNLEVFSIPTMSVPSLWVVCDNITQYDLTGATPKGGTYTGIGVTKGSFYPAAVGGKTGYYKITYTFTDSNSCVNSGEGDAKLVNATKVTFNSVPALCTNDDKYKLSVSPTKGVFAGTGVDNLGNFYPDSSGVGKFKITYTFTNIDKCVTEVSQTVTVGQQPSASITLHDSICQTADSLVLKDGLPVGGKFYGNGIKGKTFIPTSLNAGKQTIAYVFTAANGCSDTAYGDVKVLEADKIKIQKPSFLCDKSKAFLLDFANPKGGDYSGDYVVNGKFFPKLSGKGTFKVIYTYTNGNNCTSTSTTDIEVYQIGVASITLKDHFCTNNDSIQIKKVSPFGGELSGVGVRKGYFVPKLAGIGESFVYYTVKDINNCDVVDSQMVTVNEAPVVTLTPWLSLCDNIDSMALTGGLPTGGNYAGEGIERNMVFPALLGVGKKEFSYELVDGNGCKGSAIGNLMVNKSPDKPEIKKSGFDLTTTASGNIQWLDANGPIAGETKNSFTPKANGVYFVEVSNDSNCTSLSDGFNYKGLGIESIQYNGFEIYPNPTNGIITLNNLEMSKSTISLYAANGALVSVLGTIGQNQTKTFDLTTVPSGMYFLRTESANGNIGYHKIVIE